MGRKIIFDTQDEPPTAPPALAPTAEQEAILSAFATEDDLVIEAGAGSGKTTTLRLIAGAAEGRRGIYLAYNKAIADEATKSFPSNVECRTAHSFAFRAVGYRYKARLDGPRLPAWRAAELMGFAPHDNTWDLPIKGSHAARLVMETIERFCYSADALPGQHHVPYVEGLIDEAQRMLREACAPAAVKAWADLCDPEGHLKFTHDAYLKMWCLSEPQLNADFVFLDEAQDANPAIADLVVLQPAQRIAVGDSCQQIYAWRGAVDAIRDFPGVRLPLTQSFRFGPRIASEANGWLAMLAAPIRLSGTPTIDSTVGSYPSAKAILCRTNAKTVEELMRAQAAGRAATLVGGGAQIRGLAEAAQSLMDGRGTNHRELFLFKTWRELAEYSEEKAGQDLRSFVKLIENHGPANIIRAIDRMAKPDQAEITISTAHKAKGREWDSVRIGTDFINPAEAPGKLTDAEKMLSYVAVTRAKRQLDLGSLADDYVSPERHDEKEETQ